SETVEKRIENINTYFTFSLYSNVCRSLFEKHKLMFSFLLCVRILMDKGLIHMDEWRFLLSGGTAPNLAENPCSEWLTERAWRDIQALNLLSNFSNIKEQITQYGEEYRRICDSPEPHRAGLPGGLEQSLGRLPENADFALSARRQSDQCHAGLCVSPAGTEVHRAADG
ncbi:unnamed protein product, partial [Staurois parvus]